MKKPKHLPVEILASREAIIARSAKFQNDLATASVNAKRLGRRKVAGELLPHLLAFLISNDISAEDALEFYETIVGAVEYKDEGNECI